ncbi:PAS domain S-box protein [Nodosilinea sp. E11]|uniref:PAS domain S-box protein n=1 Tax=Nodosilinea sp. E11 TaxID=3037479 RepID=UPI002934D386|nr:PAS domain S-box protein [Nodosilinea sp. E11]WOD39420.1 PAS domain S-box protein [Nodosilinea sp. E11]
MHNPEDEAKRLAVVRRYQILDTPPEESFDRITAIAARLFQVPIALVSVVDGDRIWFKSRHGLALEHTGRDPTLDTPAILPSAVYVIPDACQVPLDQSHPLVQGEFGLRFYAAAPLISPEGYTLGTLSILDHHPRSLAADDAQTLADLAALVMDELTLRLSSLPPVAPAAPLVNLDDLYYRTPGGYCGLNGDGLVVEINDTALDWLGYSRTAVVGTMRFSDLLTPTSATPFAEAFAQLKRQGHLHDLELELGRADGSTLWVVFNAIAEYDAQGQFAKGRSTVYNISDRKHTELTLRQLNQALEVKVAERTAELADRNADLEASNQALHLSNKRFRNAFDYAGIGMALVSLEGQWLEVNRSLCDITGYSEAELLAITFQAITHPDDLDADLDLMDQLLNQKIRQYHLEKRYRHRQGHWIWIMLSVSMVRDERQEPLYFVSQVQDVHEHKQATLALHQSQTKLLEAQKIGHIGSWEYDVRTQKVTWSAEKFRIFGRDPSLGSPSLDELLRLYYPNDGDQLRQAIDHTLATGEPFSLRLKCTRGDGGQRDLDTRGQAERNAQGEIVRLYGISQDITERVQAEQERQDMSTALALTVEGIARLDNAGRYISVNQAYGAMVGYSPDELVGKTWQVTLHPDDLNRVETAYEQMLSQGKVNVEARGLRKDGSIFYKQLFMVAAYDGQQRHGHYCFMKDISERARLEAERRQAEIALQQELQRLSEVIATQQEVALANPNLDQVIAVVTQQAQQLTRADGAAVEMVEDTDLVCRYACGQSAKHLGWRLPVERSFMGQALTQARELYCPDINSDAWVDLESFRAMGLRSMAVIPLTYQAEPVGILKVCSAQPAAFTNSDRQTLKLIAGLLAASLHVAGEFKAKTLLLQNLQASEARYRSVVSALSEGIAVIQADGTVLTCNASAAQIVGLPSDRMVGRSITKLAGRVIRADGTPCPLDDFPPLITLRTGLPITKQVLGLRRPRTTTWISVNTQPLLHPNTTQPDDLPDAVVVSFTDITELRRSEVAALRRRAEQERLLSEIAQRIRQTLDLDIILTTTVTEVQQFLQTDRVMIYRLEAKGQGTVIAEATTPDHPSLLGRQVHNPLSVERWEYFEAGNLKAIADLQAQPDRDCPIDRLALARAKVAVPIVQSNRLWGMLMAYHNSEPRPWETSELDVLKRLAIQLAIAIQQSQLYQHIQAANRQLEHLATHDGLTQVANRRSFDTQLQQEWTRLGREQAPLSLILCDIDHFKLYNDTYGHPAGDVCLQQVAQALEQATKRPADLVARYGGEEFALVLPATDAAGAEAIARAIQRTLKQLALFHGASPLGQRITLSLGIATAIPIPERSPQTLVDQADAALYAAKHQGRDRYCMAPPQEP